MPEYSFVVDDFLQVPPANRKRVIARDLLNDR